MTVPNYRQVQDLDIACVEAHAAGMGQPFQITIRGHMYHENTLPEPCLVDTMGGPVIVTYERFERSEDRT